MTEPTSDPAPTLGTTSSLSTAQATVRIADEVLVVEGHDRIVGRRGTVVDVDPSDSAGVSVWIDGEEHCPERVEPTGRDLSSRIDDWLMRGQDVAGYLAVLEERIDIERSDAVLAYGRWLVDRGLIRGDLADYQWDSVDELAEQFFNDAGCSGENGSSKRSGEPNDEGLDQIEHRLLTKLERVRSTKSEREKATRPIVLAIEKTAKVMVQSTEFVRPAGVSRVHFCCGGPIAVVERIHPAQYVPGDTACARTPEDDTMQIWRCRYVRRLGLRWETEEPYAENAVLQRISACDLMVMVLSERVPPHG